MTLQIDWMVTILAVAAGFVIVSFWRAHRKPGFDFNVFDLIMDKGKISKFALVFMITFAVSTWLVVVRELKGTLTEGFFGIYCAIWITPVVTKLLSDGKGEGTGTVTTTKIETTEEVKT